eukprot:gene25399-30669_t
MGAAVSVKTVYKDATAWFRQYFDDATYVGDFHSIDKDHDGSVSYKEFVAWLQKKSSQEGGPWKFFISHPEIIAIAHLQAGKHLFAVSIFWAHFKKADEWNSQEENRDAFNGKLNEGEFMNAVKSFCAAYGQEKISDEQITADFHSIDCDNTGSVSLLEVCSLCAQFIDQEQGGKLVQAADLEAEAVKLNDAAKEGASAQMLATADSMGVAGQSEDHFSVGREDDNLRLNKDIIDSETYRNMSTKLAMDTVLQEVNKNQNIADLMEMRLTTEQLLNIEGVGEGL